MIRPAFRECVLLAVVAPSVLLASASGLQPRPQQSPARLRAEVAALFERHCLACHDSQSRKGGLDLSQKTSALKGGLSGRVIRPGRSGESLLWQRVVSGQMPPKERPRLSDREKSQLRDWIDSGAVWPQQTVSRTGRLSTRNLVRRLTVPEYIETVRAALGLDIEQEARRLLPPDVRADGFTNTAYNLQPDLSHIEACARLAEIIAGRVNTDRFAARFTRSREMNDANLRVLITGMGRWLLRGPLRGAETEGYLRMAQRARRDGGSFTDTARLLIEAMLQSPRFLYRIEEQQGDGKPRQVRGWELASRLSYTLWGGPPDAELYRVAETGALSDRGRIALQVRRMLAHPRAVTRSLQFAREWLDLDRLVHLRPDPKRFPAWSDRLAADMRDETLTFFKHVVWEQKQPLSALLNARVTFATPRLAEHYGLEPDVAAGVSRDGLQALYTFAEGGGDTVRDLSGAQPPLDLKIDRPESVQWGRGRLSLREPALIATPQPPARLIDAVKRSKEITIEAWVTPASADQSGPARIVTLSSGPNERNFTLGQEGDRYDARFRAAGTDANGLPGLGGATGRFQTRLTHVVYTRDAAGKARLFVNGEEEAARDIGGDLSGWNGGFRLALGNELTKDRPWRGALHLVAIYNRAMPAREIQARGSRLSRYDLTRTPGRGGLLTQGSLLTIGGDEASMVTRGLFILTELLYSRVGSPPPGLDTTPVPPKPGMSRRAVAETRLSNPACGGCHAKFEPFAFAFERFDGAGTYRTVDEHGNRLREDGAAAFPDRVQPAAYRTTAEFLDLMARSDRARRNITRKLVQFALGRPLAEEDDPAVDRIHAEAEKAGFTYMAVMTAIVMSDLTLMTGTEKSP